MFSGCMGYVSLCMQGKEVIRVQYGFVILMCVCVWGGGAATGSIWVTRGGGGGGVGYTLVLYIHLHEKKRIFKVQKVQHSLSSSF